jgi:hypothetical protein
MSVRNSIHWAVKLLLEREDPWKKRRRLWMASIDRVMVARNVPPAVIDRLVAIRSRAMVYRDPEWALRWDRVLHPSPVWRWLKIMADRLRLVRPPGYSLFRAAEFLCARRTVDLVFQPLLSDIEIEYFEALADGRRIKAIWVKLRGQWSLISAMLALLPKSLIRALLTLFT